MLRGQEQRDARSRSRSCRAGARPACGRARAPSVSSSVVTASSSSSTAGRAISARAKATRCCSPPDSTVRPFGLLVEPSDEVAQARRRHRVAQHGVVDLFGERRIGQRLAQRAEREIRPLRQRQHACRSRAGGSRRRRAATGRASARNRLDLPEPDGPLTSRPSPGFSVRLAAPTRSARRRQAAPSRLSIASSWPVVSARTRSWRAGRGRCRPPPSRPRTAPGGP